MSLLRRIEMEILEDDAEREADVFIAKVRASAAFHAEPSRLEREPCGCHACDEQIQPGHFVCSVPNAEMLRAEVEGLVYRSYTDERPDGSRSLSSAWRWFVV